MHGRRVTCSCRRNGSTSRGLGAETHHMYAFVRTVRTIVRGVHTPPPSAPDDYARLHRLPSRYRASFRHSTWGSTTKGRLRLLQVLKIGSDGKACNEA